MDPLIRLLFTRSSQVGLRLRCGCLSWLRQAGVECLSVKESVDICFIVPFLSRLVRTCASEHAPVFTAIFVPFGSRMLQSDRQICHCLKVRLPAEQNALINFTAGGQTTNENSAEHNVLRKMTKFN